MLLAVCQKCGIDTPRQIIPQIAYGFGGGIGNTGSVCGAVAGAVMAIGINQPRPQSMDQMLAALNRAGDVRRQFEAEMGAVDCRDLTGIDLSNPEAIESFMESGIPEGVCQPAVRTAYRIAVELLESTD